MNPLEQTLEAPNADGPPLVTQVIASGPYLRFVLTFTGQPKGLWRAELPNALREEVAFMEQHLHSPVQVTAVPPDMPMPSAVVATVTTENTAAAVGQWNQAVLRAFRNLSMAHGIPLPASITARPGDTVEKP